MNISQILLLDKKNLYIDQIFVSGVNFCINILLIRYLGFENYGLFFLIWSIVQFLISTQSTLTINPAQSLYPKINKNNRTKYLKNMNFIFLLVNFIIIIISLALYYFLKDILFKNINLQLFLYSCLYFFSFALHDFLRKLLILINDISKTLLIDFVYYSIFLTLLLFFINLGSIDIILVLKILIVSGFFSSLIGLSISSFSNVSTKNIKRTFIRNWKSSKWLLFTVATNWFNSNYVFFLTNSLLGLKVIGFIRAAQNIIGVTHILFQLLENIMPTNLSNLWKLQGIKNMKVYFFKSLSIFTIIVLIILIIINFYSEQIITILYKDFNKNIQLSLMMFAPMYILLIFSIFLKSILRTYENTKPIFFANIVAIIFSLCAGEIIINQLNIVGSMLILIGIHLIIFVILSLSVVKNLNENYSRN